MTRARTPLLVVALLALVTPARAGAGAIDRAATTLADQARAAAGGERDDLLLVLRGSSSLANDLGPLLRARLLAAGFRSAELASPNAAVDDAAARRRGIDLTLELEIAVASPSGLRVDGLLQALGPWPWREERTALGHLHADAPLDGELRRYVADPPPSAPHGALHSQALLLGDVELLALDAGDAAGDGRTLLAGATAEEVILWRWDEGGARLVELSRTRFGGPPPSVRPRSDVATVTVERGVVRARSSRFESGLLLRPGEERSEPLPTGYPLPGIAAPCELEPGVDWFRGCPGLPAPPRFWSAAGLRGGRAAAHAAVDPERTLWIFGADGRATSVRGAGAAVTLARLDRGDVVATSDGAPPGGPDAIVVRPLVGGPTLRLERLPGAVTALAAGDLLGTGHPALLASVRDRAARRTELWVVY